MDETKRLKRQHLLRTAGKGAAAFCESHISREYKQDIKVEFLEDSKAVEDFIKFYDAALGQFKIKHMFRESELVDYPKIAALSVKTLLSMKPEMFFRLSDGGEGSIYQKIVYADLAYRFAGGLLRVNFKKVPMQVRAYFYLCMIKEWEVAPEWLAWGMTSFGKVWGELPKVPGD